MMSHPPILKTHSPIYPATSDISNPSDQAKIFPSNSNNHEKSRCMPHTYVENMGQTLFPKITTTPSSSIPMATPLMAAQGQLLFGNSVQSVSGVSSNLPPVSVKKMTPQTLFDGAKGSEEAKFQPTGTHRPEDQRSPNKRNDDATGHSLDREETKDHDADGSRGKARKGKQCNFTIHQVHILKRWFM
eukprot:1002381-Amorphochlora_amoeboformis.AAC.1